MLMQRALFAAKDFYTSCLLPDPGAIAEPEIKRNYVSFAAKAQNLAHFPALLICCLTTAINLD